MSDQEWKERLQKLEARFEDLSGQDWSDVVKHLNDGIRPYGLIIEELVNDFDGECKFLHPAVRIFRPTSPTF